MKSMSIICLGLMLNSLIVSCTSQLAMPPTAVPTPFRQDSAIVKVRVGDSTLLTEDTEAQRLLNTHVELFEKTNPNIDIILEAWGWDARMFPAQLAAGKVPDVMVVAPTEGPLVIDNGYAADITSMMNAWSVSQDFNQPILAPFAKDGRLYAVPTAIYIMGLFYDKRLFREAGLVDSNGEPVPPTTWDEFVNAAKAIKEKTKAAGFCMLTQYNQGGWNFINWGWQAGGEFERQVGNRWHAVFNEPPIIEAMQFIRDLRWMHDVLQDELLLDAEQIMPMVAKRQCGMAMIAPDWLNAIIGEFGGNLDDLGLTVLPAGPGGHANLIGGAYTIINANASPEVQQAAFEWITWRSFSLEALESELKSPQGASRWTFSLRSLMYKPDSETAQKERELIEKYRNLPYYRLYIEEAGKYARPEPPIATQDLYAALDAVIQAVLTDENADPQALLTQATQQFQAEHLDALGE